MAQTTPNQPTSVTAQPLLDLSQPAIGTPVGYTALYYHWADGLQSWRVAGGLVVGDLVSLAGYQWQQVPLTPNSLKLTETPKETRHGTTYQVKVQGDRPQAVPNVLDALEQLTRRAVVTLVRQVDGQLRLVGSAEEPLRLLATGQGQNPGTRAGLDLLLSGVTTSLAPYYRGTLLVAGVSAAAPVATTGSVRVLDGHGNLRLTVPVGYDLVVEGPFRTELRLQPS